MFVTVDDNSSALQSCTVISMKPMDSARAECRAADGPISVRMQMTGVLLLPCFSTGLGGATKSKNEGKKSYSPSPHYNNAQSCKRALLQHTGT